MSLRTLEAWRSMALRPTDQWMRDDPQANAEIEHKIMNAPCMAYPDDDHPAVICGITSCYGIGTVWMVVGDRFKDTVWRGAFRVHRALVRGVFDALRLRRLQMLVDVAHPEHGRYAEALGFERESDRPHLGLGPKGEDLIFYVMRKGK
ncbi:MAG: hypothetical protein IAE63_06825 [Alphaproteobacteria bacterium]|nr:hypothetical protein [Alphaproteobacteria bacterium]